MTHIFSERYASAHRPTLRQRLLAGSGMAALALGLLTPSAYADEPIQVAAVALDAITITATKTEETALETLSSTTVITEQELEDIQATSIDELLRGVPGVTGAQTEEGPGIGINIRGMQEYGRVNVMIDGTRQNFQRTGHAANTAVFIEPELLKQVDIVRGPSAAVYGSGAIGGVVNFITKDAVDLLDPGSFSGVMTKIGYHSIDDTFLTSITGYALPNDKTDLFASVTYRTNSNYEDGNGDEVANTALDNGNALLKASYALTDAQTIKTSLLINRAEYTSDDYDEEIKDNTVTLAYSYSPENNDWVDLSVSTYYTNTENTRERKVSSGGPYTIDNEVETIGFDIFNTSQFSGLGDHKVTYGVDGFFDTVTSMNENTGGADIYTPGGERTIYGGFIQDQIAINSWLNLILAARFDSYELDATSANLKDTHVSPKATVAVTPIENVTVYATWAEAFRAPSTTETLQSGTHPGSAAFQFLPNPNLKPEVGQNWEVGTNISASNILQSKDRVAFKATYFEMNVEDYIDADLIFGPSFPISWSDTTYQFTNVAKAKLRGVEATLSYESTNLFGTVAYSRIRGEDKTTGGYLNTIPADKVSTTLGYRTDDNTLRTGVTWHAVASQDRNDNPSDSYNLVNLFSSYKFNESVKFNLGVDNLFNEQYTEVLNQEPSRGQNWKGAITVRF
ncbi:MAG: TonB-dependent hemoglobin/transferrin/lactoferrin family receptor [Parvibaculaceae bacterium]|nr:TonB-dependent hemoglobin/transferrin/lactoferrin family receptor [Parvibaculaceae bacterium]